MKKLILSLSVIFAVLLSFAFIFSPESNEFENKLETVSAPIPDELKSIFKASCMDCHATGGKKAATLKLDFSEWNQMSPKKQAGKAAAICKEVTKESMPPKKYKESHPETILTADQIEVIYKWSESLK
jgi:mono/diheme cytochrome c family protein